MAIAGIYYMKPQTCFNDQPRYHLNILADIINHYP